MPEDVNPNDNPNPGASGNPNPEGAPNPNPNPAAEPKPPAADARAWVPEALRGHKSLEKFKDASEVAQSYISLESAFGKKIEDHFKPDAPEDVKQRVRAALGVPEAANGYEDPAVPEGKELDKGLVGSFKEVGHKLGLSKTQAKELMGWYIQTELERETAGEAANAEAKRAGMEQLKQKWGAAADRYVGFCQQFVSEHGGPEVKAALDETGAGNDPRIVSWLAKLGERYAEDGLMTPNPVGTTREDAIREIGEIRSAAARDPKHPYVNSSDPGHKAMVAKVSRLTEMAYPTV